MTHPNHLDISSKTKAVSQAIRSKVLALGHPLCMPRTGWKRGPVTRSSSSCRGVLIRQLKKHLPCRLIKHEHLVVNQKLLNLAEVYTELAAAACTQQGKIWVAVKGSAWYCKVRSEISLGHSLPGRNEQSISWLGESLTSNAWSRCTSSSGIEHRLGEDS